MIKDLLLQLGFSENEALVYEVLLAHSPAGASYLAKKTGLARSSVYTSLNLLLAKGLAETSYKNDIKQFVTTGTAALNSLIKEERQALEKKERLLPKVKEELERVKADWLKVPSIINFEGKEGLKKNYLALMRESEPGSRLHVIRDEFVWTPEWKFIFEKSWHEKVKELKREKDINTKLLINPSTVELGKRPFYAKKKGLSVRTLAKSHTVSRFALYLNLDTILVLSFEEGNMAGIKITNKNIAENFHELFENLWKESAKF